MSAREHEVGEAGEGFWFLPPPRFAVRAEGGRFALTSEEDRGLLLVVPHRAPDAATLLAQFAEGWSEPGVELQAVEGPGVDDDGSVFVTLAGSVHGEDSRAAARAVLRPGAGRRGGGVRGDGTAGGGVLALALAALADWQPRRYAAFARMIVGSLRWEPPRRAGEGREAGGGDPAAAAGALAEWDAWLRGRRLVRLAGSGAGRATPAAGGAFGLWAARQELLLGAEGRFESVSLFGPPGHRAAGRWRLASDDAGRPVLDLLLEAGGHARIALALQDGATLLDGQRFFVNEA